MLIRIPIIKIQLYLLVFFLAGPMLQLKNVWAESILKDKTAQAEHLIKAETQERSGENLLASKPSIVSVLEYNIVVGSFKDFGNARLLRNQLVGKGYESRILSTEIGMFRVTAGTYTIKDEANVELAFVMADYDNAWVLSN